MVADVWNHCEIYIGKVKWGRCLVNVDKGNGVEQECGYQTNSQNGIPKIAVTIGLTANVHHFLVESNELHSDGMNKQIRAFLLVHVLLVNQSSIEFTKIGD